MVTLATVGVVAPAAVTLVDTLGAIPATKTPSPGLDIGVLARSIGVATLIAAIATALAVPAALTLRARNSVAALAAAFAPLLLPPYLASSGWNLLRAPNTALGAALLNAAADGAAWAPALASRSIAILGLSLWAWPIALIPMLVSLRAVDHAALDAARLEPAPSRALRAVLAPPLLAGAVASLGLVGVVMLGSAIPLHIAQFDTLALRAWIMLDLLAPTDRGPAWLAAWPSLLIAAIAAILVTRAATRPSSARSPVQEHTPRSEPARGVWRALAVFVWLLAVAAPLTLFLLHLESLRSIPHTISLDRVAWLHSAQRAGVAGLVGSIIAIATWHALTAAGDRGRAAAIVAIFVFTLAGLAPGVLVGASIARLNTLVPIDLAAAAPTLAHVARFGFVACLVGCWLAATEPPHLRDLRAIDAATPPIRWLRAVGLAALVPAIGVGLVVATLAFHEIESAVLLTPPGRANLARRLLDQLHYARQEDLSATCAALASLALMLGVPTLIAALRSRR